MQFKYINMENKHKLISHANCKRPRPAETKMAAV